VGIVVSKGFRKFKVKAFRKGLGFPVPRKGSCWTEYYSREFNVRGRGVQESSYTFDVTLVSIDAVISHQFLVCMFIELKL